MRPRSERHFPVKAHHCWDLNQFTYSTSTASLLWGCKSPLCGEKPLRDWEWKDNSRPLRHYAFIISTHRLSPLYLHGSLLLCFATPASPSPPPAPHPIQDGSRSVAGESEWNRKEAPRQGTRGVRFKDEGNKGRLRDKIIHSVFIAKQTEFYVCKASRVRYERWLNWERGKKKASLWDGAGTVRKERGEAGWQQPLHGILYRGVRVIVTLLTC